ncbi:MAG TPA: sigma 54-interacting transcriptional regulator [Spirochaetota bacterium]|nr:sigma 54-interacting transcriptional regulator [Spirochaetota bacterium]
MKLKEIMTPNPLVLRSDHTIREAASLFVQHRIDSAPVAASDGELLGLFTNRHINRAVSQSLDMEAPVESLMNREVTTGRPDDRVEEIVYFEQGQLPVIENGSIVGIITRTDFARAVAEHNQKMLGEIRAIVNSTAYMIISIDENAVINVFNQAFQKKMGITEEEAKGRNISELFPDLDLTIVLRTGRASPLQKVTLNGRPYIMVGYPIEKLGRVIGAVYRFQDITDLEAISHELENVKELNRDLDAIIESSYDGIWVTDGEGNVLRINKAYETITGLPCASFYGRNMKDLVLEGYISESVTMLVLDKREQQTIYQETKTGKSLLVTGSPVFDERGNILRVVTNVRDITELKSLITKLDESQRLAEIYQSELSDLKKKFNAFDKIIGASPKMKNLMDTVCRIAHVNSAVLITGETGTGKELIADYIHQHSMRTGKPLIKVNCGAIPENLIESELFGYETGAFTGARKGGKPGYFEIANGGSIFLDEIGEMPFNLQAKLLRVLESEEITRVGGHKPHPLDVRVIAATNRDMLDMVQRQQFREDLYYRLNVVPLNIPPLRERIEDIPYLIAHFVSIFNKSHSLLRRISPEVIDICISYNWPGNIRELKNLVERMMVMAPHDLITKEDLPLLIGNSHDGIIPRVLVTALMPLSDAVMSTEKQLLEKAYAAYRTTREMARELKIDASTIVRKAAKYGISHTDKNSR